MAEGLYTLDELAGLVEAALAVDYPGAPTGRVRDVPDPRAIRWYVTRGLVDRPAASRGRVALYGRRHLLQLVAIKRRQAQGRSLADIQAELTGVTDAALAEVARLPTGNTVDARPAPVLAPESGPAPGSAPGSATATGSGPGSASTASGPARERFWAERPEPGAPPDSVALRGIRLAPGVTLLIEDGAACPVDPRAVRAAARPLLELLASGGHEREEDRA